jgi:acyl-ACP thioesterase
MLELVPPPGTGRVFTGSATLRLADCSPGGRARLDALARILQDVSDDDARDAGFGDRAWVVRRTAISVRQFPTYLEAVELDTWCSGFGAAWAERRISLRGERGGAVESATLWVQVDRTSLRPTRVDPAFVATFGPSAGGRSVSSKPVLPAGPDRTDEVAEQPWPLRFSDFDVLAHVNNAAYWEPVEEELAERRELRAPLTAIVEHATAIERGDRVLFSSRHEAFGFDGWLRSSRAAHAALRVRADG